MHRRGGSEAPRYRLREVHPLRCAACQSELRVLAVLTDPAVVRPLA